MASSGRSISQEAFETLVLENMEEFGMDSDEALEDAIQTLTLQGVDLSGIVKCVPGVNSAEDNPVISSLNRLKSLAGDFAASSKLEEGMDLEETVGILDRIRELCSVGGCENASIAMKNGVVELLCSLCGTMDDQFEKPLISALKALSSILHDVQSTEAFHKCDGPKIVVGVLRRSKQNSDLLDSSFSVVAAAATGNEIVKDKFMELKIDDLLLEILKEQPKGNVQSLYDAIRVLLTPDDNRVLASQVYGYARRFAKIGIAEVLVDALCEGNISTLVPACIALKAVAVNDEICRSVSEKGGLDAILLCIDASSELNNKSMAKACCSLLSKLAGSDANKTAIVQQDGLNKLMRLSSKFADDPSVLQEVMSTITAIALRSPENAARAVEAGAGDMAFQAMQKFPTAYQMQRQSCHMIRNLVARNPENRTILLSNGFEKIIRKAKTSHECCKDAATDALRDLGVDNYNF